MLSDEIKENIKRHYGDTDEDLTDLGAVMDALNELDTLDTLKRQIETMRLENDKALKDLDTSWRTRYRERFFDGDVTTPDVVDLDGEEKEEPEDISIEEYLDMITKETK